MKSYSNAVINLEDKQEILSKLNLLINQVNLFAWIGGACILFNLLLVAFVLRAL